MYFSAVHYSPLLARGPLASFSWCPLLSSWPASPSSSWLVPHFMSWQAWASWHDVEQHPHGPAVWLDSDIFVLHINACIFPQSTTVHSWPERLASFSWCPLLFSWPASPSSSWLVPHLMSWPTLPWSAWHGFHLSSLPALPSASWLPPAAYRAYILSDAVRTHLTI